MSVTSLSEFKKEREPHSIGKAICQNCKHEWEAVCHIPVTNELECEKCGTFKGVFKGFIGEHEDSLVFQCNCGSDLFSITPNYVRCVSCGEATSLDCL